jgi:ribosomal protein L29
MKAKEQLKKYRDMKPAEIEKEIEKQNKDFAVLKLEVAGRKNKNISSVSMHKKIISRLLTIKNENKDK